MYLCLYKISVYSFSPFFMGTIFGVGIKGNADLIKCIGRYALLFDFLKEIM